MARLNGETMTMETRSARQGRRLRFFLRDRRGATAVIIAVTLLPLFAFAGLGVDVGIWYTVKRQAQSATDVAALSGAMELAAGKGVAGGPATTDIQNLAKYGAMNNLSANAATSLTVATGCTAPSANQICVNNPPSFPGSTFTGDSNFVEAILAQPGVSIFSGLVGYTNAPIVRTRAVAGLKAFASCMLALNTTGKDLTNSGNANLTLNNCSFISDSTSNDSIRFNGGVTMTAAAISTAGGDVINGNSNLISPPITTNAPAVSDPYAGQITYSLTGLLNKGCSSGGATLQPGLYGGSCARGSTPPMNFSAGTTTTLCPGVYYLDGEDNQGEAFVISGNGTVVKMGTVTDGCAAGSAGVTIIATCSSGNNCGGGFNVGGTGSNTPTVTLSAPSTAVNAPPLKIPAEILFYQDAAKADTNKGTTTLAGGSAVSLNGVVYTPAGQIGLNGSPSFNGCTELIAGSFIISGTPSMTRPACGVATKSASRTVLAE
jgi:Flp pilus assembly protein TadG